MFGYYVYVDAHTNKIYQDGNFIVIFKREDLNRYMPSIQTNFELAQAQHIERGIPYRFLLELDRDDKVRLEWKKALYA